MMIELDALNLLLPTFWAESLTGIWHAWCDEKAPLLPRFLLFLELGISAEKESKGERKKSEQARGLKVGGSF